MGNFSRDTFNPNKRYLGVRLQQGVPLVDADWNELNDVTRYESYEGFESILGYNSLYPVQVFRNSSAFSLFANYANDVYIYSGRGIANGIPIYLYNAFQYTTQPLRDATLAASWGVDPIPDLTTPAADRTDIVYLDVWEREIDSSEDPNIVNPVIGVETSVRLKREIAVRVGEGSSNPPYPPPAGHQYFRIALLHRTATANITNDMVEDLRSVSGPQLPGGHLVTVPVSFLPYTTFDAWYNSIFYAYKSSASSSVLGIIPLQLPFGSRVGSLYYSGNMTNISSGTTNLAITLFRVVHDSNTNSSQTALVTETMTNTNFNRYLFVNSSERRVNDSTASYFIYAYGTGPGNIYLRQIRISYEV